MKLLFLVAIGRWQRPAGVQLLHLNGGWGRQGSGGELGAGAAPAG